jgi:hypothetical protein
MFFTGSILCCLQSFSQVIIGGPVCVVPGTVYQYSIGNTSKWTATATMKVCVDGGIIADQLQSKRKTCTDNDAPLGSVLVIWNDVSKASVTVSSSAGSKTLNVNITQQLQAGIISNSLQVLNDSIYIPSSIQCSAVRGGSCSPVYSYQWQESADALTWTDIIGATSQNFSFSNIQKHTKYFRRRVTENGSGTIGYSDIAVVNVNLKL